MASMKKAGKRDLPDGVVPASNGRMAMGTGAYVLTDAPSNKTFAFGAAPRGQAKGGNLDGFGAGTKVNRDGTLNNIGARNAITVKLAGGPDPSLAALNQGNGRILPPATIRSRPFDDGMQLGRM